MGNKSILMSIQPQYVAKILNGEKTIEVRKKFPKDYVGWVYIYCTKGKERLITYDKYLGDETVDGYDATNDKRIIKYGATSILNGYVVAKFWCDNVEELYTDEDAWSYYTDTITEDYKVSKLACIGDYLIEKYLNGNIGYAIHISKLEVFDKPKELKDFKHTCKAEYRGYNRWQPCSKECKKCICNQIDDEGYSQCFSRLTKAPESWYYIEGE